MQIRLQNLSPFNQSEWRSQGRREECQWHEDTNRSGSRAHEYGTWISLDLPIRQVTLSEIKAAKAKTDAVLESLAAVIKHGWLENLAAVPLSQPPSNFREDLSIQKGFVFKSWRIEVPLSFRQCVIDKTHASHLGV